MKVMSCDKINCRETKIVALSSGISTYRANACDISTSAWDTQLATKYDLSKYDVKIMFSLLQFEHS